MEKKKPVVVYKLVYASRGKLTSWVVYGKWAILYIPHQRVSPAHPKSAIFAYRTENDAHRGFEADGFPSDIQLWRAVVTNVMETPAWLPDPTSNADAIEAFWEQRPDRQIPDPPYYHEIPQPSVICCQDLTLRERLA